MSDQPNDPRPLSEISHLFLSSVRDKTTGGAPRPQRTPPPPKNVNLDLTPEEFAQVFGAGEDQPPDDPARGDASVHQVTAIIGTHLNGKQRERAVDYARHLANDGTRIGLIEVDASEFRVMCFDRFNAAEAPPPVQTPAECFDTRQMIEVLGELSWDVQRWLLLLPQPRVPEARVLLRGVKHWAMLSTCDHDGVIACYRTLKGLTDLWPGGANGDKPRLSLALLDAADEQQAQRVGSKLVSVCRQFLNWPLEHEPHVCAALRVSEHVVMSCRPIHDKSQLATAPQWQIVADFIAKSKAHEERSPSRQPELADVLNDELPTLEAAPAAVAIAPESLPRSVVMSHDEEPKPGAPVMTIAGSSDEADVIDLPAHESGESGIVDAILRHCSGELVECPITPPMCPRARLAVGRDRRIVMLAVSRQGLADLNVIGQAYKWLQENQNLIGMAVPQLSIDTHQPPHLSLLVNQADSAAHTLQPMLQGDHVTVKTYRKLRWGGKHGLLLEAA